MSKGFTLIEVLAVTAIIAIFSVAWFFSFGRAVRNWISYRQVGSVVVSDVRRAQSMALSGALFQGNIVCGYGIHYVDSSTYLIYAKTAAGSCSSVSTRNYQSSDFTVETRKVSRENMKIASIFFDIFFEPPDPKTYINNSRTPFSSTSISIYLTGQTYGSSSSVMVSVDVSGRIELRFMCVCLAGYCKGSPCQ